MVVRANHHVHGIVLAGVHPWEDNRLDNILPRPLLPVAQRPLIGHVLRWLRQGGIARTTVCANSASHFVRQYLGDGSRLKMNLDYYEDSAPRGPAGCVGDAASGSDADTYLVADGTILPQLDLMDLLAAHERSRAWVTVVVCPETSLLATNVEHRIPVGVYVFDHKAIADISRAGYQDIKEGLIPRLHQAGHAVATYPITTRCPRVSGFASYIHANNWLLQKMTDPAYSLLHYRRVQDSHIHADARVDATARLIGPVMVGPGATIQDHATIIGPSVIGRDTTIDTGSVVCRSVLWERCRVHRQAVVDRCVLTHDAHVQAAAQLGGVVHTAAEREAVGWLGRLCPGKASFVSVFFRPATTALAVATGKAKRREVSKVERKRVQATSA